MALARSRSYGFWSKKVVRLGPAKSVVVRNRNRTTPPRRSRAAEVIGNAVKVMPIAIAERGAAVGTAMPTFKGCALEG